MGSNQTTDDHLHNLHLVSRNEVMYAVSSSAFLLFCSRARAILFRVGSGSRGLRIDTDELLLREQINAPGVIVPPFLFGVVDVVFSAWPSPSFGGCFFLLLCLLFAFPPRCCALSRFVVTDSCAEVESGWRYAFGVCACERAATGVNFLRSSFSVVAFRVPLPVTMSREDAAIGRCSRRS